MYNVFIYIYINLYIHLIICIDAINLRTFSIPSAYRMLQPN